MSARGLVFLVTETSSQALTLVRVGPCEEDEQHLVTHTTTPFLSFPQTVMD